MSELQPNSYTILTTTQLYDARQPITLTNNCGELEQSNLEDLLFRVFSGDTTQDSQFATEDYILNDGNCEPLQPDCTPEQQTEQLADLQAIIDQRRELEDLTFPTNLRRVVLCDGTETYLFDDELADLSGTYATLQTIKLTNADETVRLGVTFNGTDLGDLFRLSLYYNENVAGGQAQKNGNISAMAWQTAGRQAMAYGFRYDDLNRLKKANYSDILDNGNLNNTNRYGVNLTYDANSNIKTLSRHGYSTSRNRNCVIIIDNLNYTYANNNLSNQIVNISDLAIDFTKGFNPYSAGSGSNSFEYLYDQNGNLTTDPYKQYVATYNFLNLPENYTFSRVGNTSTIDHLYDADGTKLRKSVTGNISKTKDYCKGIEYTGNVLEAVYHSEGRVVSTGGGTFQFEYYLRDHLGSNRVIFSDLDNDGTIEVNPETGQTEVLASMDYYPFGMEMEGSWDMEVSPQNDYLYNAKEIDREYGLQLQYYGARFYDPSIGRFTGVDPHADRYPSWTPYNYVYNNPINGIDPDGRDGILLVFPNYMVDTESRLGKQPLGHAGVLLINNETGYTRYYEYGRYRTEDGTKGKVRNVTVPNVVIDPETGKPTQESLNKVLGVISNKSGQKGNIQGAYVEGDFDKMNDYAQGKLNESSDPNHPDYNKDREPYKLLSNNCGTFGCDVIKQDEGAKKKAPWIFNPTPNNIAEEYQDNFPKVNYDSKTKTTTSDIYKKDE